MDITSYALVVAWFGYELTDQHLMDWLDHGIRAILVL